MIFHYFSLILGRRGGFASGQLDHGLENSSGEAAVAAHLITASKTLQNDEKLNNASDPGNLISGPVAGLGHGSGAQNATKKLKIMVVALRPVTLVSSFSCKLVLPGSTAESSSVSLRCSTMQNALPRSQL